MTREAPPAKSARTRLSAAGLACVLLLCSAGAVQGQTLITETTWGGPGADIATSVARAADGSVYLAGNTDSFAVDSFGNPAPRLQPDQGAQVGQFYFGDQARRWVRITPALTP
jgi:hypothetical protein